MLDVHYAFCPPLKGVHKGNVVTLIILLSGTVGAMVGDEIARPRGLQHHEGSVTTGNTRPIMDIDYHSM